MSATERNRTIEAVDILNDFVGDYIASVNVFNDYSKKFNNNDTALKVIYRLCMSYLLLTLNKWLEFYDRYHKLIPADLHSECKKLTKELRGRKIEDFRNTCVGHIWNKKKRDRFTTLRSTRLSHRLRRKISLDFSNG